MNLYRYSKIYAYGEAEDHYLIQANNKDEALNKLKQLKQSSKFFEIEIDDKCLELVKFNDSGVVVL